MKRPNLPLAIPAFLLASVILLASCTSEPKAPPTAAAPVAESTSTPMAPGQAGRVEEDVFRVQAVVGAVDLANRHVTLTGPEGKQYTFTAGPEIKNLAQLTVGEKVSATFGRRLVILVKRDEAPPSETYDTVSATAQLGEKPGMMVAEETKVIARVKSIDAAGRTAALEFADGTVTTVPVRADIDLSKYRVGDNVVIRTTTALTVIVEPTP